MPAPFAYSGARHQRLDAAFCRPGGSRGIALVPGIAGKVRDYGEPFHDMRSSWRLLSTGLVAVLAVSVGAIHFERVAIEKDLDERAKRALGEAGAGWATVAWDARDVVLRGRATLESEPAEAVAALRTVWGIRHVDNDAGLTKPIEPYVWAATRRGHRVRLRGYVPNRKTRHIIMGFARAAMPGAEVVDRMKTGRGVPPTDTWIAGISFALKQLSSLEKGRVGLEGLAFSISGEAEDATAYRSLTAALERGLPNGITLARRKIDAPVVSPYRWSAQFAGGQLVLSGHVPGDDAKKDLLDAAATAPKGTVVVDRMEPAEGAPAGWPKMAAALIGELVRLESGSIELKDAALAVGGIAANEADAKAVRAALRSTVGAPYRLTEQIRVREPKVEPKPPPGPAPPAPKEGAATPAAPADDPAGKLAAAPPSGPKMEPKPPTSPPDAAPKAQEPQKPDVAPKVEATPKVEAAPKVDAPKVEAPKVPKVETAPKAEASPRADASPKTETAKIETAPGPEIAPKAEATAKAEAASPPPAHSTSPALVAECRAKLGEIAKAGRILFDSDSATLDTASFATLDRLAAAARVCPGVRIVIEGHADTEGSTEYNQKLSMKRAEAVVGYLIGAGADASRLDAAGFGATRPVAPNTTAVNRARNRRIEIVVRP
jgi:OOP family OmpA-OmpF porin